jgi:hypothetical protein
MGTTSLTTLQIFEKVLETVAMQSVAQEVNMIGAASKGSIVLASGNNPGSYNSSTLLSLEQAAILRDANAPDTDAGDAALSRDLVGGVKVAYGTKEIIITEDFWNWIGQNPAQAAAAAAQALAPQFLQIKLNQAIASLAAALANIGTTVVHDTSGDPISHGAMNSAAALFGDRYSSIVAWVMHSTPFHTLIGANLTNAVGLFTYGTVKIFTDPMGRPFIITDSPDLVADDGDFLTLGLTAGAIQIEENPGFRTHIQTSNGGTTIKDTYQCNGTFNLTLKGMKWDESTGGPSPQEDALSVGTNWDQVVSSIKDGPGVLLRCDES